MDEFKQQRKEEKRRKADERYQQKKAHKEKREELRTANPNYKQPEISGPMNIQHISHIGWDGTNTITSHHRDHGVIEHTKAEKSILNVGGDSKLVKKRIEDYDLLSVIGKGSFGKVNESVNE